MTYEEVLRKYQPTIGIECHVQLKTITKLFSGADNDARDKEPNTAVSPICFGFPGVLPVLNEQAVELAIKAGLAMNSTIPEVSRFERKHYFYPDLPKGYQITQLAEPVIMAGEIEVPQVDGTIKNVRIHHAHLEEDAGKLTHPATGGYSLVDLNRAGTPLIEIVSEADIHSPAEARAYTQELYLLMTYAGVTDGDLYHGNMRFDVNISLAPHGSEALGTRTEIKNLNSFKSVERAAEYEAVRQAGLLEQGQTITQETRGWNEAKQKTISQRSKEDAHDYRYMPEPDVPLIRIGAERVDEARKAMPLLPPEYRKRWQDLGVDQTVEMALLASPATAQLVTRLLEDKGKAVARRVAYWFLGAIEEREHDEQKVAANSVTDDSLFVELSDMVEAKELSSTAAKQVFADMLRTSRRPRQIAEANNLIQTNDTAALEAIVDQVLADPTAAQAVADVKAGNDKAIGYLVGLAMKASRGSGNPALLQTVLRQKIKG